MAKEKIEWIQSRCDRADENKLPRVLLAGDSITLGYAERVKELLYDKYYVDYIATSYMPDSPFFNVLLPEFIKDGKYAIAHINVGLHGEKLSKRAYYSKYLRLLTSIKKTKIVLATSTAVHEKGGEKLDKIWTKKLKERNDSVLKICQKEGYKTDDLYAVSLRIPKQLRNEDGVHYLDEGYAFLAEYVAESIKDAMTEK